MIAEKIHILHFVDTLGAGGTERQLVYLLQNLDRERFESYVVTTYDDFRHYEEEIRRLQIAIYSLRHGELRVVNRSKAVAQYIQLMWKLRPQIVHAWLHYPNLIARIARPFCPPHRLITAIRSNYSSRALASEIRTQFFSDFRIVIKRKGSPEHYTNTHRPITVIIPNGIDHKFFKQSLQNNTPSENTFTVLMVARIDPRKDHQTLLKAIHLLHKDFPSKLKVILIGDITDLKTQQQINKTIAEYQLEMVIDQHTVTNNILPYYLEANVSVLPSSSEEFPNVILESLATGTPAIVSEAANRGGLIQHRVSGWVFPTRDSLALAHCLKAAWETTDEQRKLMREAGRSIAAEYSIEKMVEQYQQLYERAVRRS
ncbi:MAG: glycosyltransferase [Chloroflexota bacterium]